MHPVSEWSVHPAGLAVEGYLPISPVSQQPRAPVWVAADLQAVPLLPRRCTGRDAAIMRAVMHFRGPSGGGCSFHRASHSDEHVLLCNKAMLCATAYITCSLGQAAVQH